MGQIFKRSINEPIREGLSTRELWHAEDFGLIHCWERGRQLQKEKPELAEQAHAGRLPVLWWQGGVVKKLKNNQPKKGTLWYLAVWQGLRNQDLEIDTESGAVLTCTRFDQVVEFKPIKRSEPVPFGLE